jgi:hypothetical protein
VAHVVGLAAFLVVREDAVGLVDLLELLLCAGLLADIRVIFAGEVAVRFLISVSSALRGMPSVS